MSEFNDLVERYIAVWNEVDPDQRQRLIAETFSDGASYVDPLMTSEGHTAINAMVRTVQERFPGCRFRRAGAELRRRVWSSPRGSSKRHPPQTSRRCHPGRH